MTLQIYNTLTREKEIFQPLDPQLVKMYSCGPTVYGNPHIGNYRAFFTADLIRNTLKFAGYKVKSVMNITDVGHLVGDGDEGEDKLQVGAKKEGTTAREVAKKYENLFLTGLEKMHIDKFDVMPRATEHIQEQIAMVKILEEKGYTYTVPDDGIYMNTSKIPDYGKLLGPNYKKHLENLKAGERVELGGKKNSTDFALWKFAKASDIGNGKREMERDSPWGVGFPGRHIECSAMSVKYLGEQFDIHHGGADHISIHHPNEIAQSECCFGHQPRVKYRIHNQFLQIDGGKMSKSLGNVYVLDDIEAKGFDVIDLRFFFFLAHYRSFQDFTWENLQSTHNARINLDKKIVQYSTDFGPLPMKYDQEKHKEALAEFYDDFNTPKLLAYINTLLKDPSPEDIAFIKDIDEKILKLDLGKNFGATEKIEIPDKIIQLAEQRKQAKQEKNYQLADELRQQIIDQGYTIKDTSDGYEIQK